MGATAACALTDSRITGWVPGADIVVTVGTMLVVLLMMRAVDDIRDLDYDRDRNPDRPLASGVVSTQDLAVLLAVGAAVVLAANAWRPAVAAILAVQLAYVGVMVTVERRTGWPSGDALFVNYALALPVQLLLNGFLYAGLLHSTGLGPSWSGAVGVVVAALLFAHFEFARKTVRRPRPGERTYVTALGVGGSAATAVGCAVVGVALLVAAARPWSPAALVVVLPLVFPVLAALRFRRLPRWPYGLAAAFLLTGFAGPVIANLLELL
ncbi:hypothetical protein [Actinokineospora fastidiosa]|uniref:Uncharacterized protein n=1 Tax=Actinokineospora fastidiosa TaxID=1816 RepID=A0A918GCS4_9PSEU|nr:hypothetical protein [Actinokineospora fastidiosa]GGS29265.1 hypothetical protein GCM10010171_23160 [Actinokineospora fastidiosa]